MTATTFASLLPAALFPIGMALILAPRLLASRMSLIEWAVGIIAALLCALIAALLFMLGGALFAHAREEKR